MNWVKMNKNTIFTNAQLIARKQQHFEGVPFNASSEMKKLLIKNIDNAYRKAVADNILLKKIVTYEQAEVRLVKYILSEGVTGVDEIPEIMDPETGEITQEYVPAIIAIDPLPLTVEIPVYDEEGEQTGTETIPNPATTQDIEERIIAQNTITKASAETIIYVTKRSQ